MAEMEDADGWSIPIIKIRKQNYVREVLVS